MQNDEDNISNGYDALPPTATTTNRAGHGSMTTPSSRSGSEEVQFIPDPRPYLPIQSNSTLANSMNNPSASNNGGGFLPDANGVISPFSGSTTIGSNGSDSRHIGGAPAFSTYSNGFHPRPDTAASRTNPPTFAPRPSRPASTASSSKPSAPIDLTDDSVPTPSASASSGPPRADPIMIGSIDTKALVLYPGPMLAKGHDLARMVQANEVIIDGQGEEWLRLKLKYKRHVKGTTTFTNDHAAVNCYHAASSSLLAGVSEMMLGILGPILHRGVARFEGWIKRGDINKMYTADLNILVFTLPANVSWISDRLQANDIQLDHPLPYYDSTMFPDNPPYQNPHFPPPEGFRIQNQTRTKALSAAQSMLGNSRMFQQQKTVEVQREQVDEVFRNMKGGDDLPETQPGPSIKTKLMQHQLKALTFLQQREAEPMAIKVAMAANLLSEDGIELIETGMSQDEKSKLKKMKKRQEKTRMERGVNSLWEPITDSSAKVKGWKHLVTGKTSHSSSKPPEARGAILADDMGLGKTLTIVALVASTRLSAQKFVREGLKGPHSDESDSDSESDDSDVAPTHFQGAVFGMPATQDHECMSEDEFGKNKKRKRSEQLKFNKRKIMKLESKARMDRLETRTRGTLLICPLSTLPNWEEQIKDHWNGKVEFVKPSSGSGNRYVPDLSVREKPDIRVYLYHGPNRCQDIEFLSDFDIVLTTYSTLQTEYGKQVKTAQGSKAYVSGGQNDTKATPLPSEEEEEVEEIDEEGRPMVRGNERPDVAAERIALDKQPKGKKGPIEGVDLMGKKTKHEQVSALQAIEWFRVVLDEAHFIKDSNTVAARAACYLEAKRRICLTGTPIQNKLDDVWALLKFLRLAPFDSKSVWSEFIMTPSKQGDSMGVARLQTILKHCTIRRTKDMTLESGQTLLNLPGRTDLQYSVILNEHERKIYNDAFSKTKENFDAQAKMGAKISYVNVLQQILRLRQICDHWKLAEDNNQDDVEAELIDIGDVDLAEAQELMEQQGVNLRNAYAVVAALKTNGALQCQQCNRSFELPQINRDDADEEEAAVAAPKGKGKKKQVVQYPILTKCSHVYCSECFKENVFSGWPKGLKGIGRMCFYCHTSLALGRDVIEVAPGACTANQATEGPRSKAAKKRTGQEDVGISSKMELLLADLLKFSKGNPASVCYDPESEEVKSDDKGKPLVTKSVVFSQWTSMLDKIEIMLDRVNIQYSRLDGTMKREARSDAMDRLKVDPKCEVILVSLRAGGVGLNLTAASRVYLMDPYWNPSVENQAVDRIHRMGQKKEVTTVKFIVKDSIEEKMLEVQKRKAELASLSLSQSLSKKELYDRRMEDLRTLFS